MRPRTRKDGKLLDVEAVDGPGHPLDGERTEGMGPLITTVPPAVGKPKMRFRRRLA